MDRRVKTEQKRVIRLRIMKIASGSGCCVGATINVNLRSQLEYYRATKIFAHAHKKGVGERTQDVCCAGYGTERGWRRC